MPPLVFPSLPVTKRHSVAGRVADANPERPCHNRDIFAMPGYAGSPGNINIEHHPNITQNSMIIRWAITVNICKYVHQKLGCSIAITWFSYRMLRGSNLTKNRDVTPRMLIPSGCASVLSKCDMGDMALLLVVELMLLLKPFFCWSISQLCYPHILVVSQMFNSSEAWILLQNLYFCSIP